MLSQAQTMCFCVKTKKQHHSGFQPESLTWKLPDKASSSETQQHQQIIAQHKWLKMGAFGFYSREAWLFMFIPNVYAYSNMRHNWLWNWMWGHIRKISVKCVKICSQRRSIQTKQLSIWPTWTCCKILHCRDSYLNDWISPDDNTLKG